MTGATAVPGEPAAFTVARVAEDLGVSVGLVNRAIHVGDLAASIVGDKGQAWHWVIAREEAQAWVERRAQRAAAKAAERERLKRQVAATQVSLRRL